MDATNPYQRDEIDLLRLEKGRGPAVQILRSLSRGAYGIDLEDHLPPSPGPLARARAFGSWLLPPWRA